ncbi:sialate O-acetylesterase [Paramormyrops kingsleyae]|uniref:Sialic acid acetylesterase n=1 Tax=Paramormyrops kingsleyae TaxID=1676925 RepID=A0A3B3T348_9TELE|nr:sialate O-acetylesterase [Paramormyrops kingsleyae]
MCWLWVTVLLAAVVAQLEAVRDELRFASYYGDHMVLQQAPESAVLWGYGASGSKVVVTVTNGTSNQTKTTYVKNDIWTVTLEPVKAGGPYSLVATQISNSSMTVKLTDVLFGDVWLCGGQSNMAFTVSQVINASEELAQAVKYPHVRIFTAALEKSEVELLDLPRVDLPWTVPTPELLGHGNFTYFSAVCWLFGRDLHQNLGYPVGLVESCWGGTPVEAWSSTRALKKCSLAGTKDGMPLVEQVWENTVLWNAMIHPLLNMTIKGAIWYQGEDNTNYHQDQYNCSFPAMIDDWRMAFHEGSGGQTALDFPFGFVQICTDQKHSVKEEFPELRWHQTADYGFVPNPRMKRTFMAVSLDLPDEESPWGGIHPRYKQDVALRLTLGARAVAYGQSGVSFQGPFPEKCILDNYQLNVTFDKAIFFNKSVKEALFEVCFSEGQESCKPSTNWTSAPVTDWDQNSVLLKVGEYAGSVAALRYAWRDWPCDLKSCPVYSADRVLPAPPFILHRWPQ